MQVHIRKDQRDKYRCPCTTCPKTFFHKCSLNKHVQNLHPDFEFDIKSFPLQKVKVQHKKPVVKKPKTKVAKKAKKAYKKRSIKKMKSAPLESMKCIPIPSAKIEEEKVESQFELMSLYQMIV